METAVRLEGKWFFLLSNCSSNVTSTVDGKAKKIWYGEQISSHGANRYTMTIHEFMMTIKIRLLWQWIYSICKFLSVKWSQGHSLTFVSVFILIIVFGISCSMQWVFVYISCPHLWNIFFWFSIESWFQWLIFYNLNCFWYQWFYF